MLIGSGVLVGLPLAYALARALAGRLYKTAMFDPPTLIVVALLFGLVGLAACWLPARRAAKTDPVVALRNE